MFRVAARAGTPLHVHIRPSVAGLREALSLASETNAPRHVVHINSAALAGMPVMLEMIKAARAHGYGVTTEAYPFGGMETMRPRTTLLRAVRRNRTPVCGERIGFADTVAPHGGSSELLAQLTGRPPRSTSPVGSSMAAVSGQPCYSIRARGRAPDGRRGRASINA